MVQALSCPISSFKSWRTMFWFDLILFVPPCWFAGNNYVITEALDLKGSPDSKHLEMILNWSAPRSLKKLTHVVTPKPPAAFTPTMTRSAEFLHIYLNSDGWQFRRWVFTSEVSLLFWDWENENNIWFGSTAVPKLRTT